MEHLIGKVIRLHRKKEPDNFKLYMVVDSPYNGLANGRVSFKTLKEWINNGLKVTVYEEAETIHHLHLKNAVKQ